MQASFVVISVSILPTFIINGIILAKQKPDLFDLDEFDIQIFNNVVSKRVDIMLQNI